MDLNGLPTELAQFVQQELQSGEYSSEDEIVCDALRLLQKQKTKAGDGPSASNGMIEQSLEALIGLDDIVGAIKQAFETDKPRLAERLAKAGAERYPEHAELQKYARVLAPPIVKAVPSTSESRAAVRANRQWLKAHRNEYIDNWIALKNGELLHVSPTLDELTAAVGEVRGRDILVTKIA